MTRRTMHITAGDRDYIWFEASVVDGSDISAATATVGLSSDFNTPPSMEITPDGARDLTERPNAQTVRVGLFVAATAVDGAHVVTPGNWTAWIRPSDAPSVAWVRCGPVTLV